MSPEKKKELEAEHGPVVVISHPDGSSFAFKRMGREQFDLWQKRVTRENPDADAGEKLLQERCVWPSREAWNAYCNAAAFEVESYIGAFRHCHGGATVHKADADEIPDGVAGDTVLTNGSDAFAFRRPQRTDVKRFRAERVANNPKHLENLLTSCAVSPAFAAWLEANLFGADAFGDAFVEANGVRDLRSAVLK